MNRENDRRSDSKALLEVPPSPDIAALEDAANALTRHGELHHAIALWAMALRLRMEAGGSNLKKPYKPPKGPTPRGETNEYRADA